MDWELLSNYVSEGEDKNPVENAEQNKDLQQEKSDNIHIKKEDENKANDKINNKSKPKKSVVDHISNTPLPQFKMPSGSIGLMLLMIALLLFAVVPISTANGVKTNRLALLWAAFTGRVSFGGIANSPSATGDQSAGNVSKSVSQTTKTSSNSVTSAYGNNPLGVSSTGAPHFQQNYGGGF